MARCGLVSCGLEGYGLEGYGLEGCGFKDLTALPVHWKGAKHPAKGKSRQAVSVWKGENELRVG